ncbi:MAG: hypothetical protein NVSMB27_27940 [Ktedonobacteraceae bacterium]
MAVGAVMLSTCAPLSVNSAKPLAAQGERPFAAPSFHSRTRLRVTMEGPIMEINQLTW